MHQFLLIEDKAVIYCILNALSSHAGRTIRVRVHDQSLVSRFLTRAVQAAFDWVTYEDAEYVRLSVIPDSK